MFKKPEEKNLRECVSVLLYGCDVWKEFDKFSNPSVCMQSLREIVWASEKPLLSFFVYKHFEIIVQNTCEMKSSMQIFVLQPFVMNCVLIFIICMNFLFLCCTEQSIKYTWMNATICKQMQTETFTFLTYFIFQFPFSNKYYLLGSSYANKFTKRVKWCDMMLYCVWAQKKLFKLTSLYTVLWLHVRHFLDQKIIRKLKVFAFASHGLVLNNSVIETSAMECAKMIIFWSFYDSLIPNQFELIFPFTN